MKGLFKIRVFESFHLFMESFQSKIVFHVIGAQIFNFRLRDFYHLHFLYKVLQTAVKYFNK